MTTVPYLRGLVDCYSDNTVYPGTTAKNQYLYSIIYKFINDTCSDFTVKVADNFGTAGSGHDDHIGANPAGENAWCVWRYPYQYSEFRTVDLYVLIQWADTDTFGAAPGDPGKITGSNNDGVGIQLAWMLDGSSPWRGTTNANGADTKGTPVWHPDAMVLPAPNNRVGEFNTNREYCAGFIDAAGGSSGYNTQYNMVGNPDFFAWYCIPNSTNYNYVRVKIWSCVDVLASLSGTVSASCPIVMSWSGNMNLTNTNVTTPGYAGSGFVPDTRNVSLGRNYNSVSDTGQQLDGGSFTCVPGVNGTTCVSFSTYGISNVDLQALNPNISNACDIYPIYCYNSDDVYGALGFFPYIHCASTSIGRNLILTGSIYDPPINHCPVGSQTSGWSNFVIPWIGDPPTTTFSTSGRSFT